MDRMGHRSKLWVAMVDSKELRTDLPRVPEGVQLCPHLGASLLTPRILSSSGSAVVWHCL